MYRGQAACGRCSRWQKTLGFEDNPYYRPGELAKSNAQLVERLVRLANEVGRNVATPTEARRMLGLGTKL